MPRVVESMGFPYEIDSPPVRIRYIDSSGAQRETTCDNFFEAMEMSAGIKAAGGSVIDATVLWGPDS